MQIKVGLAFNPTEINFLRCLNQDHDWQKQSLLKPSVDTEGPLKK